jgi:FlaA1/EpsC-like NDP-sugar epimerase
MDERFLVTGGSGFLGRALIKRLLEQGHKNIVAVGRNEGNMVKLKEDFGVDIIIGDIADKDTCKKACKDVTGIFHLAALKHIGLAEENVRECIMSNILGTLNLLEEFNGDFMIVTSTDKAAQVTGVYGASKMIVERLFREYEKIKPVNYRVVRYGNVLYSTGSVLCKWKDKLQKGEEIIATDLDSTRFYWTVDEAVDLIFECMSRAKDCTPYFPEMKSIRMGDLLDAMIKKYAVGEPKIKIIGLQPGENMHEKTSIDGKDSSQVEHYSLEEVEKMV